MDRIALKQRHLKYILYIWMVVPFLLFWLLAPGLDLRMGPDRVVVLQKAAGAVICYLAARTVVAYRSPPSLRWELIFPFVDTLVVAGLIWAAGRDPVSNLAVLYLLPIVECSESMSIPALTTCALEIAVAEVAATWGHRLADSFGQIYPFFFMFFSCLISGLLARSVAIDREKLAIAQDRERIAVEMHDGVQGHLVVVASQLELISHLTEADPEKCKSLAVAGKETARLAADELRFLVQRLRSPVLDNGFTEALSQFAFNISQRGDLDLSTNFNLNAKLSSDTEQTLFRVAQESLTNSVKHGKPNHITLSVTDSEDGVEMQIEDDGGGFDPNAPGGTGLRSMKERVQKLSGRFDVTSQPGHGCKIKVWVPNR